MTIFHYKNVTMQNIPNFVSIVDIWMNLKEIGMTIEQNMLTLNTHVYRPYCSMYVVVQFKRDTREIIFCMPKSSVRHKLSKVRRCPIRRGVQSNIFHCTCERIHKKCHYHSDIKCHMTLNTILGVPFLKTVSDDFSTTLPWLYKTWFL
jgi:hypothetical protein